MNAQKEISAAAKRELAQSKHDFLFLNGEASSAKRFLEEYPTTSEEELKSKFTSTGKAIFSMVFDKINDPSIKTLLLHANFEQAKKYLESKLPEDKEEILKKVEYYLEMLDKSRTENELRKNKQKEVAGVISSTKTLLGKFADETNIIVKETRGLITEVEKELQKEHFSTQTIDDLIAQMSKKVSTLIGEEKINEARDFAEQFINDSEKRLEKADIPEQQKELLKHDLNELYTLKEGTDLFEIEACIADLGIKIEEVTSVKKRCANSAFVFMTKRMAMILMQSMFKLEQKNFKETVGEIESKIIQPAYELFKEKPRRFVKNPDTLEEFAEIVNTAFFIIVEEMLYIHRGDEDINKIALPEDSNVSESEIETLLVKIQASILDIPEADIINTSKRIEAIKKFLEKSITSLREYFAADAGYTEIEAKDLLIGPTFIDALSIIPNLLELELKELYKEKNEIKEVVVEV